MCYSDLVEEGIRTQRKRFPGELDYRALQKLLTRRLADTSIKITKGFEANVDKPKAQADKIIKELIDQHRAALAPKLCIKIVMLAGWMMFLAGCAGTGSPVGSDTGHAKPRVVVTTDPELDDSNSLLRYLLYAVDFHTEGLIYSSSGVHWKGDGRTEVATPPREAARRNMNPCPCTSWRWAEGERFVDDAVEKYEQAYSNLKVHDPSYPTPAELKSKIHWGNVDFEGDISKDSEGSDLIKSLLLDDGMEPLYLLAWGGGSTIARALKSIKDTYESTTSWPEVQTKVSRKAIIQSFGDQDGTYTSYIKPNWPDVEFREMGTQTYGYGARSAVLPEDQIYLSAGWTRENISSRGPMGAHYRVWGDGKQMVKGDLFDHFGYSGLTDDELKQRGYVVWTPVQEKGSWISEGDSSTFMNLINNGLRGHVRASYGGWGGRSGPDAGPNSQYASARFFGSAQRDFASRFQWAVSRRFGDANHPPAVRVEGGIDLTGRRGETVRLVGSASDPDGDALIFRWWQYTDADGYAGSVNFQAVDAPTTSFQVPADARTGNDIHIVFEVTDNGTPALTRYQRVIVTVL